MEHRPAKLLAVVVNITNSVTLNSWNATLSVTPQPHSDSTINGGFYNGLSVVVDDYVATGNRGTALRVASIVNQTSTTVTCILEDFENINSVINPDQDGSGLIQTGAGLLFEIVNGMPVTYPLPDALPGVFNGTFPSQLIARFLSTAEPFATKEELFDVDAKIKPVVLPDNLAYLTNGKLPIANIPTGSDAQSVASGDHNHPASIINSGILNIERIPTGTTGTSVALGNHAHTQYVNTSLLNVANGVAGLDANGKVLANQMPFVMDTIVEVANYEALPIIGSANTIYRLLDNGNTYRWSGSSYFLIGGSDSSDVPYNYYSVSTDATIANRDIVYVKISNLTLTLPVDPVTGDEITVIIGNSSTTTINRNGELINGDADNYIISNPNTTLFLVYIDDSWVASVKTQFISVAGNAKFGQGAVDYWPAGTTYAIEDTPIYGFPAFLETWTLQGTHIAKQLTLFESDTRIVNTWIENKDAVNAVTTWDGVNPLPIKTYDDNLKITLCETLNIDWRLYPTFESFFNVNSNLRTIAAHQESLDKIKVSSRLDQFKASTAAPITTIPQMIGLTAPSGVITTSSTFESDFAWRAFDRNNASAWSSLTAANEWIAYAFPSIISLFAHTFKIVPRDSTNAPKNLILQYSFDGTNWLDLEYYRLTNYETREYTVLRENIKSRYWRFFFVDNFGGSRISVYELQLTGWNLI